MNFWKEYKLAQFGLLKKIYLHGSTNRHLPQTYTLVPDFKVQYLLSILPPPALHPNHHVQLVPFSSWQVSLPAWFQSLCLYHSSSSSLPRCKGQRTHKKERCAAPLDQVQTKQWEMGITKSSWKHPWNLSLKHAMPGLSSTGSCRHSNTPWRFSLLNSSEYE